MPEVQRIHFDSVMNRVLSTAELLDIIFTHTDIATDVSCTTVNRNFFESATNQIWFNLEKLDYILSILAPIVGTTMLANSDYNSTTVISKKFSRTPMLKDWNRFYIYALKVKKLKVNAELQYLYHVLQETARSRTRFHLFPNLSSIDIAVTGHSVQTLALLIPESLQDIFIRAGEVENTGLLSSFLAILNERASNITKFYLHGNIEAKCSEMDLVDFFSNQKYLRSVTLPLYTNTSLIVSSLATLPELTSVAIRYFDSESNPWGKGNRADTLNINPILSASSFPKLDSLGMAISIEDITHIFSMKYAPANISSLLFHVTNQYTTKSITECLRVLSRACPRLNEFSLNMQDDLVPELEFAAAIDFKCLQPLLTLKDMAFFSITHYEPLPWTSDDLTMLLKSWPDIEFLRLNPEPVILRDPCLHISCLEIFSELCPVCPELNLYVDARFKLLDNYSDSLPFGLLEVDIFDFGASPIENAEDVAIFLSQMCPSSFTLDTQIEDMEGAMSEDDSKRRSEYAKIWDKVKDMLPLFSKISKKYRSKIVELEEKISDLEE